MLKAFEQLEANRRQAVDVDRAAWSEAVEYLAELADDQSPAPARLKSIEELLARAGLPLDRLKQSVELRRRQRELEAKIATRPALLADKQANDDELRAMADAEESERQRVGEKLNRLAEESRELRRERQTCGAEGAVALAERIAANRQSEREIEADRQGTPDFYREAKARIRRRGEDILRDLRGLTEAEAELRRLTAAEALLLPPY